jgi:hypothetical protein
MKIEKIILSFVAIVLGLAFAGIGFYFFQATKTIEPDSSTVSVATPTQPPSAPSIFLTVDRPTDEEVVTGKTIIVTGQTKKDAVITVIANSSEDVITPTTNGDFSTTVTLEDGQNIIEIIAIAPNGESSKTKKTVTYSEEEF